MENVYLNDVIHVKEDVVEDIGNEKGTESRTQFLEIKGACGLPILEIEKCRDAEKSWHSHVGYQRHGIDLLHVGMQRHNQECE